MVRYGMDIGSKQAAKFKYWKWEKEQDNRVFPVCSTCKGKFIKTINKFQKECLTCLRKNN